MCDIQAITGLAILVRGCVSLKDPNNPLVATDWSMVVYLAWYSTSTHLAGLTSLRTNSSRQTRAKFLRLVSAVPLFVLLVAAMVPTGFHD